MPITPWGDTEALRERKLHPGPGHRRDAIEQNQRERIFAATVGVVAAAGYRDCSVADIISPAGLSRTSFYYFFDDKHDCFLATLEALLAPLPAALEAKTNPSASRTERLEHALALLADLLAGQPSAACFCLLEAEVAGPDALSVLEETEGRCAAVLGFPARPGMQKLKAGDLLDWALVDALRQILRSRIHSQASLDLAPIFREIIPLSKRLHQAASAVPVPRRRRAVPDSPPAAEQPTEAVERIQRSTVALIARHGFTGAGQAQISADAGISLATLYAYFDGKEEALESALHRSRLELEAVVLPTYRYSRAWTGGVKEAVHRALQYLESHPDLARLIAGDRYCSSGQVRGVWAPLIDATRKQIEKAPDTAPGEVAIRIELLQVALLALVIARLRVAGPASLTTLTPLATYLITAAFVDPREAARLASRQMRLR